MSRFAWCASALWVASLSAFAEEPTGAPADPARESLAWGRQLNSGLFASPPTSFTAGHASVSQLPPGSVTRSEGRFEVRFPSGSPITTPAVHAGRVVTSGGFGGMELYAIDAKTGAQVWGRMLDDDGPSAPACEDGVCVVNTESCTIFALAEDTGKLLWSYWMGDPMLSAPAIANGTVYTSYPSLGHTADGRQAPREATHALAAIDLKSGEIRWQKWLDGDVMSAPVVVGAEVHLTTFAGTVWTFGAADGAVVAVDRARATSAPTVTDGQVLFASRADGAGQGAREAIVAADRTTRQVEVKANEKDARYLDGTVQRGSGYGAQGVSLDAGNGFGGGAPATAGAGTAEAIVGQSTVAGLQSYQGSRPVVVGAATISTMGDEIVATDTRTGEVRWSTKLDGDLGTWGGSLGTSPAVAGGRLVIGTVTGEVHVLDPATGEVARRFTVGSAVRSQPVVHEGWIYVGTEDGRLVGLDTGDVTLTGWTHWGGDAARTGGAASPKPGLDATRTVQ